MAAIKILLEKICYLFDSLFPMQKQSTVSASKIEIFPHTILSSQKTSISPKNNLIYSHLVKIGAESAPARV